MTEQTDPPTFVQVETVVLQLCPAQPGWRAVFSWVQEGPEDAQQQRHYREEPIAAWCTYRRRLVTRWCASGNTARVGGWTRAVGGLCLDETDLAICEEVEWDGSGFETYLSPADSFETYREERRSERGEPHPAPPAPPKVLS